MSYREQSRLFFTVIMIFTDICLLTAAGLSYGITSKALKEYPAQIQEEEKTK